MIRSGGGIFGRNPVFNNVEAQGDVIVNGSQLVNGSLDVGGNATIHTLNIGTGSSLAPASNVAFGVFAGSALTASSLRNTLIGSLAGDAITSGDDCVAIGYNSLGSNNTSNSITAVGSGCLDAHTTGVGSTGVGYDCLGALTTAQGCTAIGYRALASSTGNNNTAIGYQAGHNITSGENNMCVGRDALAGTTSGLNNVGIGTFALLANVSGSQSIGIGASSLLAATAGFNVAIGKDALKNITGVAASNNVAIGDAAGSVQANGATALTGAAGSIYIGSGARGHDNSDECSIVIGKNAVGGGAFTTVIGTQGLTISTMIVGTTCSGSVAPTIASATTIAPLTPIVFVSGITGIRTITPPKGIATTGGSITLIPTGLFTTNTTGNIALASVAILNRALTMTYDAGTAKWYPSY